MKQTIKTPYQLRKEEKELKMYNEYESLVNVDGASRTAVRDSLMKKYNIGGQSTFYAIIERVQARLS